MDVSSFQVPVPNSRKKFIYFSIVVIVTIMITTSCILMYDKSQEKYAPSGDNSISGGQMHSPLSSNKTKRSVTTARARTESDIPTTLSGVNCPSVLFDTPTSTSAEQTPTQTGLLSHVSVQAISDVTFSTPVQTNGTTAIMKTPASTETVVTSSHISAPLTSDVTFMTPIQTFTTSSTESITIENMSTSESNMVDANATEGYPTDCSDFNISVGLSVTQTIYPYGSANKTARVNCVSSYDGVWTIIQRRLDGSVDFYRNWMDYKEGFGDVSGEYWLGNDAIHQMTSRSSYELKVVVKGWDNVTVYRVYDTFRISNESDGYRLTIEGNHYGPAGDSLAYYNGEMFSTLDRDNDGNSYLSCAQHMIGAWWYRDCSTSNLNGHYYHGSDVDMYNGIRWTSFRLESLKETKMMIRKTVSK